MKPAVFFCAKMIRAAFPGPYLNTGMEKYGNFHLNGTFYAGSITWHCHPKQAVGGDTVCVWSNVPLAKDGSAISLPPQGAGHLKGEMPGMREDSQIGMATTGHGDR